jgi:TIR domain
MSDIFISYASTDRDRARELAAQLERLGWSVWWDREIQAGKTFAGVIEREIDHARCVIVLWSRAAVDSRWVRDEANEGLKRDVLVPVLIDQIAPPLGFRSIHAADLLGWTGDPASPGFRQLVRDLGKVLGAPHGGEPQPPVQDTQRSASRLPGGTRDRRRWLVPAIAALVLLGAGAAGIAYFRAEFDRRVADSAAQARHAAEAETAKQRAAEIDAARRAQAEADAARDAEARRQAEAERKAQADAATAKQAEQAAAQREAQTRAAQAAGAETERKAQAEAARKDREAAAQRAAAEEAARKKADAERTRQAAAEEAARRAEAERQKQAEATARAAEAERARAKTALAALAVKNPEMLPSVGDTWTYRYVDGFRHAEVARLTYRIEGISADGLKEVLTLSTRPDFSSETVVKRAPGFPVRSGIQFAPPDLAPYLPAFFGLEEGLPLPTVRRTISSDATVDMRMRVVGNESVTVPAGRFDAVKVEAEGRGYTFFKYIPVHSIITIWYAPKVKRFVKYTALSYQQELPQELDTFELVDYKVKR